MQELPGVEDQGVHPSGSEIASQWLAGMKGAAHAGQHDGVAVGKQLSRLLQIRSPRSELVADALGKGFVLVLNVMQQSRHVITPGCLTTDQ